MRSRTYRLHPHIPRLQLWQTRGLKPSTIYLLQFGPVILITSSPMGVFLVGSKVFILLAGCGTRQHRRGKVYEYEDVLHQNGGI